MAESDDRRAATRSIPLTEIPAKALLATLRPVNPGGRAEPELLHILPGLAALVARRR